MNEQGSLARIALIGAVIAGTSYLYVGATGMSGPLAVAWKGAGVGLLAVYAAL